MLDIGWSELLVVGVVALIVVGPKDLPMMFRKVGQFVGKIRGMARDFQRAMDQAADETGVKDIGDGLKKATDVGDLGLDDVTSGMKDYSKNFVPGFEDSTKEDAKPSPAEESMRKAVKAAEAKREAAAEAAKQAEAKAAPKPKTAAKKAPAKKPAAKKAAAKKAPAKKPAAKKASS